MTRVIHANWSSGALHLWVEAGPIDPASPVRPGKDHPSAVDPAGALAALSPALRDTATYAVRGAIRVRIPQAHDRPLPSATLALARGMSVSSDESVSLGVYEVLTLAIDPASAGDVLQGIVDAVAAREGSIAAAPSVSYYLTASSFARSLLAQQRVIPMLRQGISGEVEGCWAPWVSDEGNAARAAALARAMPPAARAAVDRADHDAWTILDDFLTGVTDALCRAVLIREHFAESLAERDPSRDAHVAWLSGLLGEGRAIPAAPAMRQELSKRVRGWVGLLEDKGVSSTWRLSLRLDEPVVPPALNPAAADALEWTLTFHLQSIERPGLIVDAEDIWLLPGDSVTVQGMRVDHPQELLLSELGRASRVYKRLEEALEDSAPTRLTLSTRQAYEFLREHRTVLQEQGIGVQVPEWWDSPMARLGAKLRLESEEFGPLDASRRGATTSTGVRIGLGAIVKYRWEIAVGDIALSLHEFEDLASKRTPLVRINGRWVEIRPEDVQAAVRFIRENPGGQIKVADALRMAYDTDAKQSGIPIVGLEASGWMQAFLGAEAASAQIQPVHTPASFHGTLRPYQERGVSWMAFMERLGFGLCLADDMGLGKTIQLLALLAHERAVMTGVGPTLLIVPMSVVGNWIHETRRFCPDLKVLVHHGHERSSGERLAEAVRGADLVITTYALANRDRDELSAIPWWRVVLDEAQYIKNPAAKQTQAVRMIQADRRVALTGTPVENRLAELWSIMDFLNPGYLGGAAAFRQRFSLAVERLRDRARADQLRGLIRPFVLRRLKTDPNVVADLPEKVESREFCHLTSEQASLYESCVRRMLSEVDEAEGIQRRGLVLAGLVKLKQICNHPAQLLRDQSGSTPPDVHRSGKCIRLMEMLDEVLAEGDRALVFTQFREMGDLLASMLRHHLGRDVLYLHGGTTTVQRQQIVDTFQKEGNSPPVLILSLRAGGVGLNLTAATHVFHFDRWWNPAVENQATDRAYRIGQTRTVQVHKFVVRGTLEERIDQMIESKTALAENIIGSGESWLTELKTDQLREILTLRNDAVSDEA